MVPLELLDLPLEVLHVIGSYICRPSDLKALCLVSHHVSAWATPLLYQNIAIPYHSAGQKWAKVDILANSRGVADGHVRSMELGSCAFTGQEICRPLQHLFANLPKNTIRRFEYGPLARPMHKDLRFLWKSQNQLTNLVFDFSLNSPSAHDVLSDDMDLLSSLRFVSELNVNFGYGTHDSHASSFLIAITRAFPDLSKMVLKFVPLDKLKAARRLNPLLSVCLPRTLTHLSLWYSSFKYAELLPVDHFLALTHLEMIGCRFVGKLLDHFTSLALESFVYRHESEDEEFNEDDCTAVVKFLHRVKSLKRLTVDCTNCFDLPDSELVSAVEYQAGSLEYLLVTSDLSSEIIEGWSPLTAAVSKCKGLRQLGIVLGMLADIEGRYTQLIDSLPNLSVFNNFTTDISQTRQQSFDRTEFARAIFNQLEPSSQFIILAFGKNYHFGDLMEREEATQHNEPTQQCYYRAKLHDVRLLGLDRFAAIPVDLEQLKYIEPNSDLLEFTFPFGLN